MRNQPVRLRVLVYALQRGRVANLAGMAFGAGVAAELGAAGICLMARKRSGLVIRMMRSLNRNAISAGVHSTHLQCHGVAHHAAQGSEQHQQAKEGAAHTAMIALTEPKFLQRCKDLTKPPRPT